MKLLIDTHLILWAALEPDRLPARAEDLLNDRDNVLLFSVVSLWEIAIKQALGREDFEVDAHKLRRQLSSHGYEELPVFGEHALAVAGMPRLHGDPFDRLLLAQALHERALLLTSDRQLGKYPDAVFQV